MHLNTYFGSVPVFLVIVAASFTVSAADVTARWRDAVNGRWDDPVRWTTDPKYPDNNGTTYDVVIDAIGDPYTIDCLDCGIVTVNSLTVNSTDATLDLSRFGLTTLEGVDVLAGHLISAASSRMPRIHVATGAKASIYASTTFMPATISGGGTIEVSLENKLRHELRLDGATVHLVGLRKAELILIDDASLTGTGKYVFDVFNPTDLFGAVSVIETERPRAIESGITIETGAGRGTVRGPFVSNATIHAKTGGGISIEGGNISDPSPRNEPFVNLGLIKVTDGGGLTIGANVKNEGRIESINGHIEFRSNFDMPDFGDFFRTNGTVTLSGDLETSGGELNIDQLLGGDVTIRGRVFGGIIRTDNDHLVTTGARYEGTTIDANLLVDDDTTIVNGGIGAGRDVTLDGGDLILIEGDYNLSQSIVEFVGNQRGEFKIDFHASLTFESDTQVNVVKADARFEVGTNSTFVNHGNILASGTDRLAVLPSIQNFGLIEVANGAEVSIGGEWSNRGTLRLNEGVFSLSGEFTAADIQGLEYRGGRVVLGGRLRNAGNTITLDNITGPWIIGSNGRIYGGELITTESAHIWIERNAHVVLDGVTLNAVIYANEDAYVSMNDVVLDQSTIVLDNADISVGRLDLTEFSKLIGVGEIRGFVRNFGTIRVGGGNGALTFGDFLHSADAELIIEIGGTDRNRYNQLTVDQALLEGSLSIELINGFIPDSDDVFEILTGDSIAGTFANAPALLVLGDGQFDVEYTGSSVILTNFVPEPSVVGLLFVGAILVINRRHGSSPQIRDQQVRVSKRPMPLTRLSSGC